MRGPWSIARGSGLLGRRALRVLRVLPVQVVLGLLLALVHMTGVLAAGALVEGVTRLVDAALDLIGVLAYQLLELIDDRHALLLGVLGVHGCRGEVPVMFVSNTTRNR